MHKFFKYAHFSVFVLLFFLFSVSCAKADSYDLELADIVVSPSNPAISESVEIKIKVRNNDVGELIDLRGIRSYDLDFEDFSLDEVVLPTISELRETGYNEFFSYIIKGSFNEIGTSRLYFYINRDQSLPETSFGNNYIRKDIEIRPAEDLIVRSIRVEPSYVPVGKGTSIKIRVKNNGVRDLVSPNGLNSYIYDFPDFTVEDKKIPTVSESSRFEVGDEVEFVFEGRFKKSGEKSLNFQIDYNDDLEEFNEENNSIGDTVQIADIEDVDLAIKSIEFSKDKDTLLVRDEITITVIVENKSGYSLTSGDGLYERSYKLAYGGDFEYISSDIDITEVTYPSYPSEDKPFEPGKTLEYKLRGAVMSDGVGKLTVIIDQGKILEETNEDNNTMSVEFTSFLDEARRDDFDILNINCEAISSTSLEITWETTREIGSHLEYRGPLESYFNSRQKLPDSEWPYSKSSKKHNIKIEKLEQNKTYYFFTRSEYNDVKKQSEEYKCTTPVDDTLIITGEEIIVDQASSSASFLWQTNLKAKTYVYYKIKNETKYKEKHFTNLVTNHNLELLNLNPGTYQYYLESISSPGSKVISKVGEFVIIGDDTSQTETETEPIEEEKVEEAEEKIEPKPSEEPLEPVKITNTSLFEKVKGKIILRVESKGEAFYVNPGTSEMHSLGRPKDAFMVMRDQGIGISNRDLEKIPIGFSELSGVDSDQDGLIDAFEDAIGTNKDSINSDNDSFNDKEEILGGYNPNGEGEMLFDQIFATKNAGKIFLQVENRGEAWYINPTDNKRYFLARPADAFSVMRQLGLGISNSNFDSL